jgi:hypothetical protein
MTGRFGSKLFPPVCLSIFQTATKATKATKNNSIKTVAQSQPIATQSATYIVLQKRVRKAEIHDKNGNKSYQRIEKSPIPS